ncbi:MAG: DHHA1 domain-containing protein, partial [Planctomycetota bacterium]
EFFHRGRLALVEVPVDLEAGADAGETAREILRGVESVEVVLLLRSLPGGRTKLSARGGDDFDVFEFARRFGGGGHRRAAGAKLELPLEQARAALLDAAAEWFEEVR